MKPRLLILLRLFVTFLVIFLVQKVIFMLVNIGFVGDAKFGECVAVLWHGLRLDIATASYLLIIPALTILICSFFNKQRTTSVLRLILNIYFWFIAIVMTLVFCADVIVYHYWGAKIDAADLIYAAKPKDLLASVSWWTIPLGIIVISFIVYLTQRLLRRTLKPLNPETFTPLNHKWHTLLFIPLLGLVFLGMRGGVSQSTANPSYAYFSKHPFCNHSALNPLFNMFHSLFKVEDLEHTFNFMSPEEAESVVAPLYTPDNSLADTLLATTRPDILLIIWEGGGWNMVMDSALCPNLHSAARHGLLFTNCYAASFRTDRGVLSILSGWPGLPTTSLMKMSDKCHKLPSLARQLASVGYDTRFVYGGDIDFTNMRCYLSETGYQTILGSDDFPESRSKSNWGAPDAYALLSGQLCPQSNSALFSTVLTLSSHEPWDVPMHRLADKQLNAFAYTDSCIGVLLDSLRTSPRWDNLLVIILPDHGIPYNGSATSDPDVAHIPVVWTGGALRQQYIGTSIDLLFSQSDLAATLLAQMQLDHSMFPLSRNILGTNYLESLPKVALHSFKNGCNLIEQNGSAPGGGVTQFDCIDNSFKVISGKPVGHEQLIKALLQYLYHISATL